MIKRKKFFNENIEILNRLFDALQKNDKKTFEKVLQEIQNINDKFENGLSILHLAVRDNKTEMVKLLLKHKFIDVNLQNKNGDTPLHLAVTNKNMEALKLLLRHPNIDVNVKDNNEYTPLHYAVQHKNNIETVKLLLKHPNIDVNVQNEYGNTPLHYAVQYNNIETVKLLLKHPNIDVNIHNDYRHTTLYSALVKGNNIELVKLLLQHPNIDISAQSQFGYSPLHWAVNKNNIEIITLLLNKINLKNKKNILLMFNKKNKNSIEQIVKDLKNNLPDISYEIKTINTLNVLGIKSTENNFNNLIFQIKNKDKKTFAENINDNGTIILPNIKTKDIDWELVFSDISSIFKNADIGKRKQILRNIFKSDNNMLYLSKKIIDFVLTFSKENELKITVKELSNSQQNQIEGYSMVINSPLKSNYISPNEFTYLDIKKIKKQITITLPNKEKKTEIQKINDVVFVNSKTGKIQTIKDTDFIRTMFGITNSVELDKYYKEFSKLINTERFSLFTTNEIAETYPEVECSGSCMRTSKAIGLIETDNRVKLIVIKDNLRNELVGRALMWEGDDFILVDSAYSSSTIGMQGDNMLREFAWKIAINKNKTFYIRLGKGGSDAYYIKYDDKINPPIDLTISSKGSKEGVPNLILKDFKFNRNVFDEFVEYGYDDYENYYGTLYMDTFKYINTDLLTLSTYDTTGNDILLR